MTVHDRGIPSAGSRAESVASRQAPSATRGAPAASSVPVARGAPAWGIRPRLVVDVVLTLSFVVLMSVPLTGLWLHEWWGIGLIVVIVVHLLAQWDWTVASSRRFLGSLTGRLRLTYLLNWLLFIATVLVMVSGILISEAALPGLGLPTARSAGSSLFRFWRLLHTVSADAVLVLAGLHLGLNWRWVLSAVRQIVGRRQARRAAAVAGEAHS